MNQKMWWHKEYRYRGSLLWYGAGLVWLIGLIAPLVMAGESDSVENTRTALEKWVETRRVISQEKRDFEMAREMLEERIALVQREIESLRSKIDEAQKSIAEADKKRADLIAENEKFKETSVVYNNTIVALEEPLRVLLAQLPEPIRERVKPLSQRLPDKSGETKLTVSERFQNVIGILNEINKSHGEISITSEVRTLPDGTSAEVATLYLGIGYAFYTGANGTIAGIGTISEEGWTWRPANEVAPLVSQAIAILKNEQVAAFVQLPVEIK